MFPHYITAGPPQREELLREILIIIFRRGVFTNFIKQNYTDFEDLKILRGKSL